MLDVLSLLLTEGWIYLLVYLLLLSFILIDLSSFRIKYSIAFSCVGCLILFILLTFRWETGTDWDAYYELFDEIKLHTSLLDIYHFDIGYVFLNYFVSLFSNSYTCLLFVNSAIILFTLFFILRKIIFLPNVAIFVLYCSYFFLHFMGGNRRAIAIVFVCCFYLFVFQKKRRLAIVAIIIAFLFHRSSLLSLIVLFIPNHLFSKKTILLILMLSVFLGATQLPFKIVSFIGNALLGVVHHPIIDAMTFYTNTDEGYLNPEGINGGTQTIISLFKRSLVLLLIYSASKLKHFDKLDSFLINIYVISILIYSMFSGSGVLQVLSTYLAITEIFILGRILVGFKYRSRLLLFAILSLYGFLQLLNSFSAYPYLYIPYKFAVL